MEEDTRYALQLKYGNRKALETIFIENIQMVVCVAKRFQNQGLTLHDLIIKGNLGLTKAIENFDETKGFKFSSYALWCIRQSIVQAIAEYINIKPIPLNKIGLIRKSNSTYLRLGQYFNQEPGIKEITGMLEFEKKIFWDVQQETNNKTDTQA